MRIVLGVVRMEFKDGNRIAAAIQEVVTIGIRNGVLHLERH